MSGSSRDLLIRTSISCGALGILSLLSAGSWLSLSLIDQVVLLGLAVVLPLVIGDLPAWWAMATAVVALGFAFEPEVAALSVLPIVVAALAVLLRKLHAVGPVLWWDLPVAAEVLAVSYGVVAALSLLLSRSRFTLLGLHEPIVELTAVHYTFAGAGALFLAASAMEARPRSR